jgi:2-oxoglutarate dehydrogenase E1 component
MKPQKSMQELWQDSYLSGENDSYLENLYESYLQNPDNVPPEWREYFNSVAGNTVDVSHQGVRNYFLELAKHPPSKTAPATSGVSIAHQHKQEKVIDLISAYRSLGHLQANIDPLGLYRGINNPTLELSYYGFTNEDLQQVYDVGTYTALNKQTATLNEIYQSLRKVYCGTLGVEYMHMMKLDEVSFIQQCMEQNWANFSLDKETKLRILDRLIVADGLEKYLGLKYVGQKRFSLEGGDSLIPLLDTIVTRGMAGGLKDLVIGMAHRGRLNVLVNILGKAPSKIFEHFEDQHHEDEKNSGDVKYHLGFSTDLTSDAGSLHVSVAFNPSHLEIVSPVVQGSVRARQRRSKDIDRKLVMPIQIHGDAAFAGQGVVMETFSMSQARWFWVGGSIHIVINNQVGFTISNPLDARSSIYCTDVAKMVQAPIIHVNGNDPEAVVFAATVAAQYRERFKKDIVIDLVCYRRHGHNEADEPSATQPIMYQIIKAMPTPAAMYAAKLIEEGIIDANKEKELTDAYRKKLDTGKSVVSNSTNDGTYVYNRWQPFMDTKWTDKADTAVPLKQLKKLGKKLEALPEGFVMQPQVKKMMEARQKMTEGELPLNWGYAETMAYATLLEDGFPIRLCGQDACRGTFAHRHAVLHDQKTDQIYIPLSHLSDNQAQINLVDSLLSEEAVMAFEYGFASTEPNNLDLWEAQFGDFANGAQVVIDQFISSGEQKWGRLCGLVLLLPHGQEGIGPEHSSARLERYLQLCAQNNIQVCVPSTPAQIFHLLRRQMIRPYRKPLIVMTPKSLLRNPLAVSSLDELAEGEFQLVIPELENTDAKKIERVIMCCGKIYYELLEKRREEKLDHIALIRLEQLYPFPDQLLKTIFEPYAHVKDLVWCQEEPINQGAWYSIQHSLRECLGLKREIRYVGRPSMAAPSGGYNSVHIREQAKILKEALS